MLYKKNEQRKKVNLPATIKLTLVLSVWTVFFCGCADPYSAKKGGVVDIFKNRNLNALNSSRPSLDTQQYLRLAFLTKQYEKNHTEIISQLSEIDTDEEKDLQRTQTVAELALLEGRKYHKNDMQKATQMYLTAAETAYRYLLDESNNGSNSSLDPSYRLLANIYNACVSELIDIYKKRSAEEWQNVKPVEIGNTIYNFSFAPKSEYTLNPYSFTDVRPSYQIKAVGLTNNYYTSGLGAPLVGLVQSPRSNPEWGRFYPPRQAAYPVTAILKFNEAEYEDSKRIVSCSFELYDCLATNSVELQNQLVPMEADFTTPMAVQLENIKPFQIGLRNLLKSDEQIKDAGLIMLEPYRADKIPVVMVHGLMSSPLTWVPMFNDLRGDPQLRKRYQFWFFAYPTGLPIMYSASLLRQDLIDIRKMYDPDNTNPNFDQMVLIGHSMGGLLSRLMVQDSENIYWDAAFKKPLDELKLDDQTKEMLRSTMFFNTQPYIKRIVFVAVPHSGSSLADQWFSKMASGLINLPSNLNQTAERLMTGEDISVQQQALSHTKRFRSSIEALSPESLFMKIQITVPLNKNIPYHSIIGIKNAKQGPGSSDGVVAYESSHVDFAESEIFVPTGHSEAHRHPLAIQEIKRVLSLHLKELSSN